MRRARGRIRRLGCFDRLGGARSASDQGAKMRKWVALKSLTLKDERTIVDVATVLIPADDERAPVAQRFSAEPSIDHFESVPTPTKANFNP